MTDTEQRARLNAIKLSAVLRDHGVDLDAAVPGSIAGGAALATRDGTAWLMIEESPHRAIGIGLAWMLRNGCSRLSVVVSSASGTLARRALGFTVPIEVWHLDERVLLAAIPEPFMVPLDVPEAHRQFAALIEAGGAAVVEEHGVLSGEVLGLEVCRVVQPAAAELPGGDPGGSADEAAAPSLEVGIGAHDRDAFQMLHGSRPKLDALQDVVAAVASQRRIGAAPHPLNRLAPERLLRALVIDQPAVIGATEAVAVSPPTPRPNVKDSVPCAALAVVDGRRVGLAFAGGVDLDLVPFAVDICAMHSLDECWLVGPARDQLPIIHEMAAMARPMVRVVDLVVPTALD